MREELIDDKLKVLRPFIGARRASSLRQAYFLEEGERERAVIENLVDSLISRVAKRSIDAEVVLPPPDPKYCAGDIGVGMVEYLGRPFYEFLLKRKDLNRHVGIFGSTGTGKTTLAAGLIRSLAICRVPVLVIDWETSYRSLAAEIPGLRVYTVGESICPYYVDILSIPPGISRHEYAKNLVTLISHDYLGGQGSDTVLLEYLIEAYDNFERPTFRDLRDIVFREIESKLHSRGRLSGRSGLWKETVLRQSKFLSTGAISRVIDADRYVPVERFLEGFTVLELGGLKSPHDRAFIAHVVLNDILLYLQKAGVVSEELKFVIVMEEFHNLLGVDAQRRDSPLIMIEALFREIRKYGVGLVAVDQTPSEIPNGIYANMNTKVCFSLNTAQDTVSMGRAMNMMQDDFRYLGMLRTGEAVVSVKQSGLTPFVVRVPLVRPLVHVDDGRLRELSVGLSDLSVPILAQKSVHRSFQGSQESESSSLPAGELSALMQCVLADIVMYPFDGVDRRTRRLGIHQVEMTRLHAGLASNGLVVPVTVDGKKLFEITPGGKDAAELQGLSIQRRIARGGVVHGYAVDKVVRHLRALGLSPKTEVHDIDVVDEKAGVCVEIETGKSDIAGNLAKLSGANLKYKFCLGVTKEAELAIRKLSVFATGINVLSVNAFTKLSIQDVLSIP